MCVREVWRRIHGILDPHGDLVEKILGIIPPERIKDVVLVDPADEEFAIGFNIVSAQNDHEKTLLASDLVSVFQRLSTSWGDQMQSVFQNAILAFLNSSKGGTLADLRRFLVEPAFRQDFLKTVSDPNILYYWQKGFAHLSGNKSIGPILTRLEMFLSQRPIAHMVSQPENRLDFGDIMDSGKIFLAKLPEGLLGKENSYLLGAVLVSKFQQLVMARQAKKIAARRDFWIYIDEFANFITPSMAEILSGARKYRIGLTLAHHELHQLQRSPDVASAVMTHPYTRIVFRVGDDDARKLAEGFSSFEADDLKNLETGQAICRVERSNFDFNLLVPLPELPSDEEMEQRQKEVIAASRAAYGTPRSQVEAMLRDAWEVGTQVPSPIKPKSALMEQQLVPPSFRETPAKAPVLKASEPPNDTEIPKDVDEGTSNDESEHESIKKKIRDQAETWDYTVTSEEFVEGSTKRVDLVLRRGGRLIACEVNATTQKDYEISNNITKCLKAGFIHIAVVSRRQKKLALIKQMFSQAATPEQSAKVAFYSPSEFLSRLHDWAMEDVAGGEVERGKPKKQPVLFDEEPMTPDEQVQRDKETQEALIKAMKFHRGKN
jgi:hypothetical protein